MRFRLGLSETGVFLWNLASQVRPGYSGNSVITHKNTQSQITHTPNFEQKKTSVVFPLIYSKNIYRHTPPFGGVLFGQKGARYTWVIMVFLAQCALTPLQVVSLRPGDCHKQ